MSFTILKQHDSMDCGPTCLAMICKHYGRNVSVQLLREKAEIGKEGVNILGISLAAESIGFRTQAVKLTYDLLVTEIHYPVILHWRQNHFAVLYKSRKKKLYVADPAIGLIQYSPEEFKQHWESGQDRGKKNGVALLIEPTPEFFKENSATEKAIGFNGIFKYLLPHKKLIIQLFFGLAVGSTLQLILPFLTQSIVDTGINTSNLQFIYVILLAQIALIVGRTTVDFVRSWILLHISTQLNISILTDFLIKMMKLPLSFFDSKNTGDIMQRISDHKRIESFLTGPSLTVMFSFINIVIFSVVLALYNTTIFFVFLFTTVLYTIWVIVFLKRRRALDHKRFEIAATEQNAILQLVQGIQEIKLNGVEKPMRWKWEDVRAQLFRLGMKNLSLNQWQQGGVYFVNEGKNIFITFLAAKAVIDGQMTLGGMLAIQYIIGQLNSPVDQMINFAQSWQNAKISLERLNEIHSVEDEEPSDKPFLQELPVAYTIGVTGGKSEIYFSDEGTALHTPDPFDGFPLVKNKAVGASNRQVIDRNVMNAETRFDNEAGIKLTNVSYCYPGAGNEPVLKNLNLFIPKGKTTAIVGESGSGKTTLLKLLLKIYQPQKGDIKLDNTPLNIISHQVWRRHCGVVMQDSYIFSDTIARNIAVGIDKIDMQRLYKAVEIANIREFIDGLPLAFNTKIGAGGVGISMGQRQRILIARAVWRNPDFIFMDEATNSLDANNESAIVNNLAPFFYGKTVIVVAHRLSTVRNADQIVLLNKGIITECGTHEELVGLKGEYYKLIKNQLELGT